MFAHKENNTQSLCNNFDEFKIADDNQTILQKKGYTVSVKNIDPIPKEVKEISDALDRSLSKLS